MDINSHLAELFQRFFGKYSSRSQSRSRRNRRTRWGQCETLETRLMLAADIALLNGDASTPTSPDNGNMQIFYPAGVSNVDTLEPGTVMTVTLKDGVLNVAGTSGRDWIVVRQQGDVISVDGIQTSEEDELRPFSKSDVARIELSGKEGDDYLAFFGDDFDSFGRGVQLSGGDGRDALVVLDDVSVETDSVDKVISLADYDSDMLHQARFELLYKFRDRSGYVGHYDVLNGETHGDGEGTLFTAIAAIAIATGNYHQDEWESAEANTALEELLGTLMTESWGNRDGMGREHPIRHSQVLDYDKARNAFRQSPMTKDSFGAIVAAAHYAYDNPHSTPAVRQLARDLMTKWSEYLVLNQWRTHSNYIAGEFDSEEREKTDPNTGEKKNYDVYKHIFNENGEHKTFKGPEGFLLLPHEIYAFQNVAADMGIATNPWTVLSAMPAAFIQTIGDVAAPYLGDAAGQGIGYILDRLNFGRDYDIKVNLGGREVSVLKGNYSIGIPQGTRDRIVTEFSHFITDAIQEAIRSYNFQDQFRLDDFQSQSGDLVGLALNRILDLLPDQLGKDSWRSILTGAVQQVLPWLSYSGLIETGTFIVTLQTLKDDKVFDRFESKPDVASYTMWSYATEFETRPEMADLLKPFVQEFFSFLRADGNPNSLWAWLAEDKGRVNEHLRMFELRMSDPVNNGGTLSSEFAYSSTKFNEFLSRTGDTNKLFPRLDYIVLQGLAEKGPPRGVSDVVSDWGKKFADAAEKAFGQFVEGVKEGVRKAGEYVKEQWDAAGGYIKERWDAAGNYLVERRDAAGKYVTERWDAAGNYVQERGDAAGKYYTEQRDAAGAVLSKGWKDGSRWVSQTLDKSGQVLKEWIYYDDAGQKIYQWRTWANGKLTNFEQYTTSGLIEINKYISTSGKWVSQTLDSAGKVLKEWIYYDDAGQKIYQWRTWADGKLTNFEQYTNTGLIEINKFINTSGQWISQKLNSAGQVLQEWIYYDAAGSKLKQYGEWSGGKLTELAKYASDGATRTFWAYVSTSGNWVERSYSKGVETSVKVWNSAGKYLGDQLKNYSDAASKLDPTTKNWWPL